MPAPLAFRRRFTPSPFPDFGDDFKDRVIAIGSGMGTALWSGPFTLGGTNRWGVTSDGYGTVDTTVSTTRRAGFLTPYRKVLDQDIYTEVQFDKVPVTAYFAFNLCGRETATDGDHYDVMLYIYPDLTMNMALRKRVANANTVLVAEAVIPGLTFAINNGYAIRLQVFGGSTVTIRAKVWVAGTPEPTTWFQSATDTALVNPGGYGWRFYSEVGATTGTIVAKFRPIKQLSRRIAA